MEIKHKGHTIKIEDSIQDLNICRFQTYNLNVLLDAGIGSDLDDLDKHINSIAMMIAKNKGNEALQELGNMHQLIYFIIKKVSPKFNSFAALVTHIDGKPIDKNELTQTDIQSILGKISKYRFPIGWLVDALAGAKKKIDLEFEVFFPRLANDDKIINIYNYYLKRTAFLLRSIFAPSDEVDSMLKELDSYLLDKMAPKSYGGPDGVETRFLKGFEQTCLVLEQNNISNPKGMTVLGFYQAFEMIQTQHAKNKLNGKSHHH